MKAGVLNNKPLETRSATQKLSDLRNPFKKWKPSKQSKQTTRALKQVNMMHDQLMSTENINTYNTNMIFQPKRSSKVLSRPKSAVQNRKVIKDRSMAILTKDMLLKRLQDERAGIM